MNCVTNISQIKKIYSTGDMHHVQAPVVYVGPDEPTHLFADEICTVPVSYKLLNELLLAGVVVCNNGEHYERATGSYIYGDSEAALSTKNNYYAGYNHETGEWVSTS